MADDSKGVTQTYSIKSMQGFMIFPNQITTYVADHDLPWEYVWIEFDGLRVKSILDTIGLSLDKPVYHARNKNLRKDMANEMLYIARNKDASPFHLIGHLYLFLDYLMRSAADEQMESGGKLRDFYIHEALTYIEHNFQNDITIEDIASVLRTEPHLLREDLQGGTGKNAPGVPGELPDAQGGRAAEADPPIHRRHWHHSGLCQSDALFQGVQKLLRCFSQGVAQSEPPAGDFRGRTGMTLKDKTARFPESNWKPGGFSYSSYAAKEVLFAGWVFFRNVRKRIGTEITAVMHSASGNAHQTCSVP